MNIKDLKRGDHVAIVSNKHRLGTSERPLQGRIDRLGDKDGHWVTVFYANGAEREFRIHGRGIVGLWRDYADTDAKARDEAAFQKKRTEIEGSLRAEATERRKIISSLIIDRLQILGVASGGAHRGRVEIIESEALDSLLALVTPLFREKLLGGMGTTEGETT